MEAATVLAIFATGVAVSADHDDLGATPAWARPVAIGDLSVQRSLSRNQCEHKQIELQPEGEIVRCRSCGAQVGAFWALTRAHEQWRYAQARLDARKAELEHSFQQRLTFIAAKRIEQAWRRRGTLPGCPHCGRGIMADDHFARVDKEAELAQRHSDHARRDQEHKWGSK